MMQRLLLAFCGLVVACGGGEPGDHVLDIVFDSCEPLVVMPPDDMTRAERRSLEDALDMWNARGLTRLTLELLTEAPRVPLRFRRDTVVFGEYDDEAGRITISRDIDDAHERAVTIAHELGHAMGLWHVSSGKRRSVMNSGNTSVEPTAADNDSLIALWGNCTP